MGNFLTNPSLPGTAASVPNGAGLFIGGTIWSNPNNILVVGVTGATNISYTSNSNHYSQLLEATNIQWKDSLGNPFTFPGNAIIQGIQLTIVTKKTSGTSAVFGTYNLLGTSGASSKTNGPWSTGVQNTFTFGNATDLWGNSTITPAQLNSTNFGWSFQEINTQLPGSGADTTVFYGELTVWYAVPQVITPSGDLFDQGWVFNVWGPTGNVGPPSAPMFVQSASTGNSPSSTTTAVVLGSTPTPGNMLVAFGGTTQNNAGHDITLPTGFTLSSAYHDTTGQSVVGYRTVLAGDGNTWTFSGIGNNGVNGAGNCFIVEVQAVQAMTVVGSTGTCGNVNVASTNVLPAQAGSTFCIAAYFWYFNSTYISVSPSSYAIGGPNGAWPGWLQYPGIAMYLSGAIPNSAVTVSISTVAGTQIITYATAEIVA